VIGVQATCPRSKVNRAPAKRRSLRYLPRRRPGRRTGLYVTLSEKTEELEHVAASHGRTLDGLDTYELAPIADELKIADAWI
jgi:hypothetical protein